MARDAYATRLADTFSFAGGTGPERDLQLADNGVGADVDRIRITKLSQANDYLVPWHIAAIDQQGPRNVPCVKCQYD